jgi:2'-5' RNA ligase
MAEDSKFLRLFVALKLPDEVRSALGRLQDELRRAGAPRLRWVRPEGIHLTLKFLGAVGEGRVPPIIEALAKAIEPFELKIQPEGMGGFGGQRLRVVWIGLGGDTQILVSLARCVDDALAPLGFERERRPFAAHLTLARVPDEASREERSQVNGLIEAYQGEALPSMALRDVSLMRSILGPGGATYQRLASFPRNVT